MKGMKANARKKRALSRLAIVQYFLNKVGSMLHGTNFTNVASLMIVTQYTL